MGGCSGPVSVRGEELAATNPDGYEAGRLPIVKVLALAQGLIDAGKAETAYRLLRRAAIEASAAGADTAAIRFLAARALLAGRHYSQAADLLRSLAEDRPELDRVKLDYAEVLFILGRDKESGEVFRNILASDDLPPPVRRNVERFLERIRARQRWRYDFDIGFWYDDNVNNAPDNETVSIPALSGVRFTVASQPVSAWVVRTGALSSLARVPDGERAHPDGGSCIACSKHGARCKLVQPHFGERIDRAAHALRCRDRGAATPRQGPRGLRN